MEMVIAVILSLISPTVYEYQTSQPMTIDECLEQARDFNSDPDHLFIIVCMPVLSEVQS